MDQRCEKIKYKNENSASSVRLENNLLDLHYNILANLKDKLAPFIGHILKAPYENEFHWWFCLFSDPRYAAHLKEIRELHGVEGVHIKTVILEMKAHFLDYVSACENMHSPIFAPINSTLQEVSIYLEYEGASPSVISEQQTNMYMNERVAQ